MNREVDEIGTSSLLRRGNVDGQYVAHSFKWIKQNLRIKHFYGTSENAVKTQIWIAVSVYVLAAIIKKALRLDLSLYTFLQILSVRPFEKIELLSAFQDLDHNSSIPISSNQFNLFEN